MGHAHFSFACKAASSRACNPIEGDIVCERAATESRFTKYGGYVLVQGLEKCLTFSLTAPSPLLDIDVKVGGTHIVAPIETTIIKTTKPLTSPWLFVILVAAYIIGFAFFARAQSFQTPADSFIGCTSTYWLANNGCGQDGDACGPFDNSTFDFRCPAQCDGVILQNPRTVGNEQTAFKPLIVGGGDSEETYRGDSFICAAAVQAYVI